MPRRKAEPQSLQEVPVDHDSLQESIVGTLRAHGCLVLQTNLSKGRVICDAGVPDLLVRRLCWPSCVIMGMEVKPPGAPLSHEQRVLNDLWMYPIVRSPETALEALSDFESQLGIDKRSFIETVRQQPSLEGLVDPRLTTLTRGKSRRGYRFNRRKA